jgi:hypothetical protein
VPPNHAEDHPVIGKKRLTEAVSRICLALMAFLCCLKQVGIDRFDFYQMFGQES